MTFKGPLKKIDEMAVELALASKTLDNVQRDERFPQSRFTVSLQTSSGNLHLHKVNFMV